MNIFAQSTSDYDTLVLGLFYGEELNDTEISTVLKRDKFEGNFGASYVYNTTEKRVLVLGLGKKENFDQNKLREIMAKAQRLLTSLKSEVAYLQLETDLEDEIYAEFAAIGLLTGEYAFDKYKTKKSPKTLKEVYLNASSQKSVDKGVKISNATSFARNLSNEPAQFVTPETLAQYASQLDGIETKIYERDEVAKMGMNAYLAVGQGSINPPKFIHMHYKPQNPKKTIALIGKGITFDSGGMDLKPAASMLTMRDDMSGAACVIAVMSLLNEFKPDIEVHGIIAACENMISGKAYKPGDILTAKNGKTIEVENTDAEGRITLADALCYACELEVDEIIDIATLTGACMVALGSQCAGLLGNNKNLMDKIQNVANNQGERFWQLPMFAEYFDMLKSDVADMKNTGGRWGGASSAGTFLNEFVNPDIAWAHLDIAGTAFLDKPQKDLIKGATGIGVRTLINYILGE
ncbi:leucyl aminopeptidase [bacterium]|nr:leucyl aminopeptidase [bacterium]